MSVASPTHGMKPKPYLVCSTVRSGSTLLCKTLAQLGGYGQPEEYFHRHTIKRLDLNNHPDKFLNYCHSIFQEGLAKHGIFGLKMHWWQLSDFIALARQVPQFQEKQDLEILNTLFPDLRFIYLWRRDIPAQAVSAAIALQTGHWHKTDRAKPKTIKFQPWKIYDWEKSLREQNQCWRQFFQDNRLNYYEITYEALVNSFTQEITNAANYIGDIPVYNAIEMSIQQQSDLTNQRFIRCYSLLPKPILRLTDQLYRQLKKNSGRIA